MTVMPARDDAPPPTTEDADYIARALVTHLAHTVLGALAVHPPSPGLDAEDFSRFLGGELTVKVRAIEQRIASLLPPIHAADPAHAADAELRKAAGRGSVRAYLRTAAREGEYVRTAAGLRRVVE